MTGHTLSDDQVIKKLLRKGIRKANGCIEYIGRSRTWFGYKTIKRSKRVLVVHRLFYILMYGPIPKGTVVMHTCDNPACFNLKHLKLGTKALNAQDRNNKNRQANGERSKRSSLTNKQIIAIRKDKRPQVKIAKSYGVHQTSISAIKRGYTWKHIAL